MNEMCGRNSQQNSITKIRVNDETIDDPQQMATKFNEYFTNIGPNLANNIPASAKQPSDFLKGNFPNSMFLMPTKEFEVSDVSSNLKNSKGKGFDNIPINLIKGCNAELSYCSILAYLNNQSFNDGVFPDVLKVAKVIPVYKSDDIYSVSNYRPISVLTTFSKITRKTGLHST